MYTPVCRQGVKEGSGMSMWEEDVQPMWEKTDSMGQKVTVSPLGHHKAFQMLGEGSSKAF